MTQVNYKCDCCKGEFVSGRERKGDKLCADCIELRRFLKGYLKRGLTEAEVLKRGRKLLTVKAPATTEE